MQPFIFRIILIIPCFWLLQLFAQPKITTFSKENGLTSQVITTTLVDSKGVVWVATVNGLNAYTGSVLCAIKSIEKQNSTNLQAIGKVNLLHEDHQQNIWVASEQGIFMYNREFWTYFQPKGDEKYTVKTFFEDRSGNIWVTFEYFQDLNKDMGFSMVGGKLQCYMNNRWYNFDEDVAGTSVLKSYSPENYFNDILQDRQGNIWFATLKGVFVFNGKGWDAYEESELEAEETYSFLEDHEGKIWIGTENGISMKDDEEWHHFRKKDGLKDHNIYHLEQDRGGRIWAWSKNDMRFTGLNLFDNNYWQSFDNKNFHLKREIEKLIPLDEILIAFSEDGVSKFSNAKWVHFDHNFGLNDKNYSMIFIDRKKTIWLAAESGLYLFKNSSWDLVFDSKEKWTVTNIYTDKQGRVWIGTSGSGLYLFEDGKMSLYDETNGMLDDSITEIFEDRHRNIWIVSKKGITKFEWSLANH